MAAGTVISGGFPGRVAQEVQPNPKCNGCLHFDGQAGRTGACTIGLRPWLCGDGDAADIGYAPIARGAGSYLPGMSNTGVHAPAVGDQDVSDLYGAGSTRPVQFQQVSLGEEHVHFVKSMVSQHTAMQRSMCRLCKSAGMIGIAPANVGPQVCTCEPIEARDIAKALMPRLSNLARTVVDLDDATGFVYACAKSGFAAGIEKGTFYQQHGKYEVSAAGGGKHHVDFHPRGGGAPARVGTFGSHKEARAGAETHARRFAAGTGSESAPHSPADDAPTGAHRPSAKHKITFSGAHSGTTGAHPISIKSIDDDDVEKGERVSFRSEDDMEHVAHPRSWVSHARTSHGTYQLEEPGMRTGEHARLTYQAHDGSGHVTTHPSINEATRFARQHHAEKTGKPAQGRQASANYERHFEKADKISSAPHQGSTITRDRSQFRLTGPDHVSTMHHTLSGAKKHAAAGADHYGPVRHIKNPAEAEKFHAQSLAAFQSSRGIAKSLDDILQELHDEEDVEKSLRWSHKKPGQVSASHGKYSVNTHHDADTGESHHVVTYSGKNGTTHQTKFSSHRAALGAIVEHHLKNRPAPKPRKKKDPNAPKKPKAGGGGGGPCPPCP